MIKDDNHVIKYNIIDNELANDEQRKNRIYSNGIRDAANHQGEKYSQSPEYKILIDSKQQNLQPIKTTTSRTTLQDQSSDNKTQNPSVPKKWRFSWQSCAFLSCLSYTVYNYASSNYAREPFAAKAVNSMVVGSAVIIHRIYYRYKKNKAQIVLQNKQTEIEMSRQTLQGGEQNHHRINGVSNQMISTVKPKKKRSAAYYRGVFLGCLCGISSAMGTVALYLSFDEAAKSNSNSGITVAMLTGGTILSLFGSFFIYKERVTMLQFFGSLVSVSGIIVLSMANPASSSSQSLPLMMIVWAMVAMLAMSARILISKKACQTISIKLQIELMFIIDFIFGLILLALYFSGVIDLEFKLWDSIIVGICSIASVSSEMFLFMGIMRGVMGPVVAIVGVNSIFVTLLNWLINGIALTSIQAAGILGSVLGVTVISIGDLLVNKFQRKMKRRRDRQRQEIFAEKLRISLQKQERQENHDDYQQQQLRNLLS